MPDAPVVSPPGICLHLLGKEQAERAAAQSEPEILHSDLSALLLELLQVGAATIRPRWPGWISRPRSIWPPRVACWRRCRRWTASGCRRLAAKWQRLATSRGWRRCWPAAQTDDEAATAAKLAAILEEPPRGGLVDLGAVFSRQQANWQQRAQQLMKRLAAAAASPMPG
ncbi:ATP-dependent helicase HrpB [Klebsiella pneumoniae]|uniref:ATP-dependent helicase HrpB n=1 Tax=Klebsiella pneumoniae TaxID=573 RepID=A0A2X3EVD7_KLEPN|nr:ATP-dependent helicase HrpB [Klebsiella pneumoniae]